MMETNKTINEIWKDIDGYFGIYQISNLGRVKSIARYDTNGHFHKERIFKPQMVGRGYLKVILVKDGIHKQKYIHRLVGISFVDGYKKGLQINHKDEDKTNNRFDNLEWVTCKENINYGTRREKQINKMRTRKPVLMFTKDGIFVQEFRSIKEAGRAINANSSHIADCCYNKPKFKSVKGYIFKFK